ncbi:MAG TPA: hypothetical protein VJ124_01830 [Pyrinomonadaceae bacterium]|nr:hypothetical protein [Pyrinomonadaceae bacterium]
METTVNKIVPHEDMEMEVHIRFLDESHRPHPEANVIVFIEKQDHSLSEVRSLAIHKALDFLSQIIHSEGKSHGI